MKSIILVGHILGQQVREAEKSLSLHSELWGASETVSTGTFGNEDKWEAEKEIAALKVYLQSSEMDRTPSQLCMDG